MIHNNQQLLKYFMFYIIQRNNKNACSSPLNTSAIEPSEVCNNKVLVVTSFENM